MKIKLAVLISFAFILGSLAGCGNNAGSKDESVIPTVTGSPVTQPAAEKEITPVITECVLDTGNQINGLSLYKETKHFSYYCSEADLQYMEDVINRLEDGYEKVCLDFDYDFQEKVDVEIYPTSEELYKYSMFTISEGVIGVSGPGRIQVISPEASMDVYYQMNLGVPVHEFTHLVIAEINDAIPRWLDEGACSFEGKQMGDLHYSMRFGKDLRGEIPSFEDLKSDERFDDAKGYPFSYTLVEYITEKYGFDKIIKLIKAPSDFEDIFNTTEAELWEDWKAWLYEDYKNAYNGDWSDVAAITEKPAEKNEYEAFKNECINTDYYKGIDMFIPGFDLKDYQCILQTDRAVVWIPVNDDPQDYREDTEKIEPALEKIEEYLGTSLSSCTTSKEERVHFFYGSTQYAFTPCYSYDKPAVFAPDAGNPYCYHSYVHEMVHILTARTAPGGIWALEGLAVYLNDFLGGGSNYPNYKADLDQATLKFIDRADIMDKVGDDSYYYTTEDLSTDVGAGFYTSSGSLVKYMAEHIGFTKFMEIYNSPDISAAIKDKTGKDLLQWKSEWLDYIKNISQAG